MAGLKIKFLFRPRASASAPNGVQVPCFPQLADSPQPDSSPADSAIVALVNHARHQFLNEGVRREFRADVIEDAGPRGSASRCCPTLENRPKRYRAHQTR